MRNGKLEFIIHFWIGKAKADDMRGEREDKAVKLMFLHNETTVVFREVEGHESPHFKNYFKVFG
ncbi:unnamed protein product [Dibothriocephalus latus]|uniref:Gelsolin-like domain-containing protein n=1 Tax=Dibothriocephalus latus TaxID=60516 RepID=A0A3P6QC11_DIBLA|nr:unnamed protein product [Dibothriocephalus latus]